MTLLKISEAAKFLQVHPTYVRRLIKNGTLAAVHLGPKTVRVKLEDLQALGGANDLAS